MRAHQARLHHRAFAFQGNVFNAALFFQDDWKVNKILTLSGGLRWEAQNHIADHSDWAPRVAFAYALDGHKKGTEAKDCSARRLRILLRPLCYRQPDESRER